MLEIERAADRGLQHWESATAARPGVAKTRVGLFTMDQQDRARRNLVDVGQDRHVHERQGVVRVQELPGLTAREKHASVETRYHVGLDPEDVLRLPTNNLAMRTMRHTCIALNHDAGVPRELIRGITGHEFDTIDQS